MSLLLPAGLRSFQENLRWSSWQEAEGTLRLLVPAKFHYGSGSLFGSNTMWKLQPITPCSLDIEKKYVRQIALGAGTERFPSARQMCARGPGAREANVVSPYFWHGGTDCGDRAKRGPENRGEAVSRGRRHRKDGCSHTDQKFTSTLPPVKDTCNFMKLCFPSFISGR